MSAEEPLPSFKPRRPLGRTGFVANVLGIGDLADRNVPLEKCVATVRRALDAGLNVIDTAPGYENGYSEEIVAAAVRGRRDGVFVIDKLDHHDQPVAGQVDSSLARLRMDLADLFVFHGCSSLEGWQKLIAPGGGMDQLAACIQAGKTRFGGISSHNPAVLRAAVLSGRCNVVMFAVGPFCDRRYTHEILPLCRRQGVGTVCFKTFGGGKLLGDTSGYGRPLEQRPRGKFSSGGWHGQPASSAGDHARTPETSEVPGCDKRSDSPGRQAWSPHQQRADDHATLPHLSVRECVHYTLTLDPDVALLGMSFANEMDAAFAAAADFAPLSSSQLVDIAARAKDAMAGKGPAWWDPEM